MKSGPGWKIQLRIGLQGVFEEPWGSLGASWVHLGASGGVFEVPWSCLGGVLGPSEDVL